jgi:hypothetical protein
MENPSTSKKPTILHTNMELATHFIGGQGSGGNSHYAFETPGGLSK